MTVAVLRPLDDHEHHHAHAHEALEPHGGRYDSILDAIGYTPLVALPRMSPRHRGEMKTLPKCLRQTRSGMKPIF